MRIEDLQDSSHGANQDKSQYKSNNNFPGKYGNPIINNNKASYSSFSTAPMNELKASENYQNNKKTYLQNTNDKTHHNININAHYIDSKGLKANLSPQFQANRSQNNNYTISGGLYGYKKTIKDYQKEIRLPSNQFKFKQTRFIVPNFQVGREQSTRNANKNININKYVVSMNELQDQVIQEEGIQKQNNRILLNHDYEQNSQGYSIMNKNKIDDLGKFDITYNSESKNSLNNLTGKKDSYSQNNKQWPNTAAKSKNETAEIVRKLYGNYTGYKDVNFEYRKKKFFQNFSKI